MRVNLRDLALAGVEAVIGPVLIANARHLTTPFRKASRKAAG